MRPGPGVTAAAAIKPSWPFPPDDPYRVYAAMRAEHPVRWSDDVGAWLVLSYQEALTVLRGPGWSADPRNNPELLARLGGGGPAAELVTKMLLFTDPPEHDRLRRAVSGFFAPRRVELMRRRIASIVTAAFDAHQPGDDLNVLAEIGYPVPLAVICELLDVGVETAELLRSETPAMVAMFDLLAPPDAQQQAASAALAVMLALVPIVAERRKAPGDDLLSALLGALEPDDAIVMALLLLAAGHETTSNLIANATLALGHHRDQLELLRRNPTLVPAAIEELLRWDSPVQVTGRVALSSATLAGQHLTRGDQVAVMIGAANRDPAVFADPDRLDVARPAPAHLAFGHGAHYCVGAALARAEAAGVLRRLTTAEWKLVASERAASSSFRRLSKLTIEVTRAPR
jgi:cytochrome P450